MRIQAEPLDERKQRILKAVVHEHVETAEPVGSEALAQHYDFGVRPATLRNEMAEMADMGYLRQPHTSAGRVPSDMGYRFYVDRLMDRACLRRQEAVRAKERLFSTAAELDEVISYTCRILTGMTRYTSVATKPAAGGTAVRHISLSKVGDRKLLLVVALSDGRVEHRIVDCESRPLEADITRASNLLSAQFVGSEIQSFEPVNALLPESQAAEGLYSTAVQAMGQLAESLALYEASVCVEGANCVLRQPEFQELTKLEAILTALGERTLLYQLLSRAVLGPDVTVIIGSENPYREMRDTSFIAAQYRIGQRTAGTIGIVGPTRMNYRRAVAAVEAMARNLSELLTDLSLS